MQKVKVCGIKRITPRKRHAARFVLASKYSCTGKQVLLFRTRKQVVSQIGQSGGGGTLTLPLLLCAKKKPNYYVCTSQQVLKYAVYQAYHTQKKQVRSFKRTSLACSPQKKLKKTY
jgi:hypothetical protein